jgi:hypothetical protein
VDEFDLCCLVGVLSLQELSEVPSLEEIERGTKVQNVLLHVVSCYHVIDVNITVNNVINAFEVMFSSRTARTPNQCGCVGNLGSGTSISS